MTTRATSEAAGLGNCPPPCGKVRYSSRKYAKLGAARIRGRGGAPGNALRAYQCHESEYWHLTSHSAEATASWKDHLAGREAS